MSEKKLVLLAKKLGFFRALEVEKLCSKQKYDIFWLKFNFEHKLTSYFVKKNIKNLTNVCLTKITTEKN